MGTLFGSSTHTGSFRKKRGDMMTWWCCPCFPGCPTSSWGPDSARFPKEDYIKAIREGGWDDDGFLVQNSKQSNFGGDDILAEKKQGSNTSISGYDGFNEVQFLKPRGRCDGNWFVCFFFPAALLLGHLDSGEGRAVKESTFQGGDISGASSISGGEPLRSFHHVENWWLLLVVTEIAFSLQCRF